MWIDWLDLPKLTTLTTQGSYVDGTFTNPRHITLESGSHPLWMMFRHAQSHRCVSWMGIQLQEWRHNPRKHSLHPSLTNRHRSSSRILQLITEKHVTPLFVPHTTQHPLPSTSELVQRHSRERYRCANTEIMTIRIWNDGNPIRMVETRSDDHSLQIAWNPHRITLQNTHIASPFNWESKQNHSTIINKKQRNTHRRPYLIDYNPQITIKHHFTQQSLLSKCNHSTQPSFPLPNLKVNPNLHSHQINSP